MVSLTIETLNEFKQYFDAQMEMTLATITSKDSDRLIKNKINGFFIAIQDKMIELNPKVKKGFGGGPGASVSNASVSHGLQTPLSNSRSNHPTERVKQTHNMSMLDQHESR